MQGETDDVDVRDLLKDEEDFDADGYYGESEPPDSAEIKRLKSAKESGGVFTADDIQEELYKLDYEDLVAGIPCRFKYRQVDPESYGLTTEDILLADDKELNDYVSLKKVATYRDKRDKHVGKLDKKRKRLRSTLRERLQSFKKADQEIEDNKSKVAGQENIVADDKSQSSKQSLRKRLRKKKSKSSKDDHRAEKEMDSNSRRKSLYM